MTPAPCPLHPECAPIVRRLFGEFYVRCGAEYRDAMCWSGPQCDTEDESIARWNEVVGAYDIGYGAGLNGIAELKALLFHERKHADALASDLEYAVGCVDTTLPSCEATLNAHRERRAKETK